MKTKKAFLEQCSFPELMKKTLDAGGLTWAEINEMRWDAYDASIGSVPGMIYYKDTVSFAKRNFHLILEVVNEYEDSIGEVLPNKPSLRHDGKNQYYNWYSWFAWEYTLGEVLSFLEEE